MFEASRWQRLSKVSERTYNQFYYLLCKSFFIMHDACSNSPSPNLHIHRKVHPLLP